MKRVLAILISCMMILPLTACAGSSNAESSSKEADASTAEAAPAAKSANSLNS